MDCKAQSIAITREAFESIRAELDVVKGKTNHTCGRKGNHCYFYLHANPQVTYVQTITKEDA